MNLVAILTLAAQVLGDLEVLLAAYKATIPPSDSRYAALTALEGDMNTMAAAAKTAAGLFSAP